MIERDQILRKIENMKNIAESILKDLVSIPTVNPPGEKYLEFCNYVKELLSKYGISSKIIKVPDEYVRKHIPEYVEYPRYILIANVGSGDRVLHLNGHYDVVPPGTGWTITDPFKPVIIDDKLYGRGSDDMKGGITSAILTLLALKDFENILNGRVEIALVPDEEIGGITGTGYLVREMKVRPNFVIVCEPTGLDKIVIGNKGLIWLIVEIFGKQAHAATPWLGVNAFEIGIKFLNKIIDELKSRVESVVSKYEYDIEGGNKATIVFGGDVKSCGKINMVTGYFSFSIDRRVIPEENVDDVEQELYNYLYSKAREMNIQINIKTVQKSSPAIVNPNVELVKTLEKSIKDILNIDVRKVVCTGGLDTRYYQEVGIQAVTYGPGDVNVAHKADEYVRLKDVVDASKIYVDIALRLLR